MWFFKNEELDRRIRDDFGIDVERASRGELFDWSTTPEGRLGLVVLLDQFPRNIYRSSHLAYAQDIRARPLVLDGIEQKVDEQLTILRRFVFYLPLMHAEDRELQELSVNCYERLLAKAPVELRPELENALTFAGRHREIVARFGRFPHRNAPLGRQSTAEELEFLTQLNSSF